MFTTGEKAICVNLVDGRRIFEKPCKGKYSAFTQDEALVFGTQDNFAFLGEHKLGHFEDGN